MPKLILSRLLRSPLVGGGGVRSAVAGLASVSNEGMASSTAATVAWPAVQAGDMAILLDVAVGLGAPTAVTPSGFDTECNGTDGATTRALTSYRMCDGTETGNITGMNGSTSNKKALLILRGNVPFASVTGAGAQNGAVTGGSPAAVVVPASGGTPPLLVIGCYHASGTVDPRVFSTTQDGEASFNSNTMYIAWKLYLAAPADTSIDMQDEGERNVVQGFYANLT